MKAQEFLQTVHTELTGLWSDLDRIQVKQYTLSMKIKSAMKDIAVLKSTVEEEIGKMEASDDAADYT
ncbi:hypothetical protein LCGC14_1172100 [marine sediment metagenome]|uniref:Uncharacterized protein n=1 Tax=marine sediment metagenome TaxID=412755 RepID=A0A0F9MCG6_9ZZZZ